MRTLGRRWAAVGAVILTGALTATVVAAEESPLECWWRTDVTAVRVGQPFELLLTCSQADNESITAVADESRLDPGAIELTPFEVVGGTRAQDLRANGRRFFQYQYTLRLFGGGFFGKDVPIPSTLINFRLQTRIQGDSVEGISRSYVLPAHSIRIISVVPAGASAIRDAPFRTFGEITARRFRANELLVAAVLQFGLSAAIAFAALARLRASDEQREKAQLLSARQVLRGARRELASVDRERELGGWTKELVARAAGAIRIGGACALAESFSQTPAAGGSTPQAGQLAMRRSGFRRRWVYVSSSITARALEETHPEDARSRPIEQLHAALKELTAAQYGQLSTIDGAALDLTLQASTRAMRLVAADHRWPTRLLKGRRRWHG